MTLVATVPATFYVTVGGNDVYWRVDAPAKSIGARVCKISESQVELAFLNGPAQEGPFRWRIGADDVFDHPDHEGTAVWTRPCLVRAVHALSMRDRGHLTVAEVDDNYLSATHLNLFMRQNRYGAEEQLNHLRAMSAFDRVVFSTVWLRDTYRRAFRKAKLHLPELFVCRNHVDLDDWPERIPARTDGKLRIGWMGSPQHHRDISLAFPALAWAAEQGHEVVMIGHDVRDEDGVVHPRAARHCRAWRAVISTHIPWIDPREYHRTAQPLDIGLAPLERNEHTLGKSDVKFLEYTMSGAATVASRGTVYETVRHGETGLLASSPADMLRCVRELAHRRSLRERLVEAAQQYVREERSLQNVGRHEWMEAVT